MEQLFEKYENIQLFLEKYRKYEIPKDEPDYYDYEGFKNKMQIVGYISHSLKKVGGPAEDLLDIYLFKHDSKYIKTTVNFKKLIDKYRQKKMTVFLFTKEPLSIYIKKAIKQYSLDIQNYLYKHFIMELNKGPLCSRHTVLTEDEARRVCFELMTHGHRLPSISIDDPQNIWIGGKVNDIIKIESTSEMVGRRINYRIVTPVSGRVEQPSAAVKPQQKKVAPEPLPPQESKESKEESEEEYYEDYDDYVDDDGKDEEAI
jgi:DNA-directed RNA polymerase subunit H (RpoH/RPB5)